MKDWPEFRDSGKFAAAVGNDYIAKSYYKGINKAYETANTKNFVGWDYVYNFTMLKNNGVDARPAVNLVSNLGFRPDASHTKEKTAFSDFPTRELDFPLRHPPAIKSQIEMEVQFFKQYDPNFKIWAQRIKSVPVPHDFKKFARKLLLTVKKIRLAMKFKTDYRFSFSDYFTYIFEHWGHKKIVVHEKGGAGDFSKLKINHMEFFWPQKQPRKELTAIWQEVWNTPLFNPHSYLASLKPGDIVIDAGTAEGFFTQLALQKGATVFAFEPLSILEQCLNMTFEKDIARGRAKIVRALLGKENKMSAVQANAEMLAASKEGHSKNAESVPMTTLDAWVKENHVERLDFLKMDIEGGEMNAMKGAADILRKYKPRLAIAVYHDYDNANLVADIIKKANPDYEIEFRGIFDYGNVKPRPYMVIAY